MIKLTYDIIKDTRNSVYQVRSKTDLLIVEFPHENEREIFEELLVLFTEKKISSWQDLLKNLNKKFDKDLVLKVVNDLKSYNIFDESDLSDNDLEEQILFWKKVSPEYKVFQDRIESTELLILGNGVVLNQLESKAKQSGFRKTKKIEIGNTIDNVDYIFKQIEKCDIFILDADSWNPYLLEEINSYASTIKKPWILVRGIEGMKGMVGPLFIPGITGCYHCFISRLKSNMDYLPYYEEYENYLKSKRKSSAIDGSLMLGYDIITSICILELVKYTTDWLIPSIFNSYTTINIENYSITHHALLKSPNCIICKPQLDFNPGPWLEPITLKNRV